jgi:hypothetical protein
MKYKTILIVLMLLLIPTALAIRTQGTVMEESSISRLVGNDPFDLINQLDTKQISLNHGTYLSARSLIEDQVSPHIIISGFENKTVRNSAAIVTHQTDGPWNYNDMSTYLGDFEPNELLVLESRIDENGNIYTNSQDKISAQTVASWRNTFARTTPLFLFNTETVGLALPNNPNYINELTRYATIIAPKAVRSAKFGDSILCNIQRNQQIGDVWKNARNNYYSNSEPSDENLPGIALKSYALYGNPLTRVHVPQDYEEYIKSASKCGDYYQQFQTTGFGVQDTTTNQMAFSYNVVPIGGHQVLSSANLDYDYDNQNVLDLITVRKHKFPKGSFVKNLTFTLSNPQSFTINDYPSFEDGNVTDRNCFENSKVATVTLQVVESDTFDEAVVSVRPLQITDCNAGDFVAFQNVAYDFEFIPSSSFYFENLSYESVVLPNGLISLSFDLEYVNSEIPNGTIRVMHENQIVYENRIQNRTDSQSISFFAENEESMNGYVLEYSENGTVKTFAEFDIETRLLDGEILVGDFSSGNVPITIILTNYNSTDVTATVTAEISGVSNTYNQVATLTPGENLILFTAQSLSRNEKSYNLKVYVDYDNKRKIFSDVLVTNHDPVIKAEDIISRVGQAVPQNVEIFDEDGDTIQASYQGLPASPLTQADLGDHNVTVTANDGVSEVNKAFLLRVLEENYAPELFQQEDINTTENEVVSVVLYATDIDGDNLSYNISDARFHRVDYNWFEWKTEEGDVGIYNIEYDVVDGNVRVSRTFTVNVTAANLTLPNTTQTNTTNQTCAGLTCAANESCVNNQCVANTTNTTNTTTQCVYVSDLIAFWKGEGNSNDELGHQTDAYGVQYDVGVVGRAMVFDGSDRMRVLRTSDLDFGRKDYSMDTWIKVGERKRQVIMSQGYTSNRWWVEVTQNGNLQVAIFQGGRTTAGVLSQTIVDDNQWHHVAATFDRDGMLRLYIDGVEEAAADISLLSNNAINGVSHDNTYALNIGAYVASPVTATYTFFFNGLMDELSLYGKVLALADIQAIYQAGDEGKCLSSTEICNNSIDDDMNGQTDCNDAQCSNLSRCQVMCMNVPDLIGWWQGDNGTDAFGHVTDVYGTQFVPGLVRNTFSFDGVDDRLRVLRTPDLNFGTVDYTVETWIKTGASSRQTILGQGYTSNRWWMEVTQNGKIQVALFQSGVTTIAVLSQKVVADNQWHHIAATFDRDGMLRLYIDGVEEAAADISNLIKVAINGLTNDNTYALNVGASLTNPTSSSYAFFFNGLIDEVSIYRRILGSGEVQSIFNTGSLGKCLSTPVLTEICGNGLDDDDNGQIDCADSACSTEPACTLQCTDITSALIGFWKGENGLDEMGHVTDVYGVQSTGGLVGSALEFDGINDRLRIVQTPDLNFATTDYTLETWIKTGAVRRQTIMAQGYTSNRWFMEITRDGKVAVAMIQGSFLARFAVSTTRVVNNQWHHVAATFDRDGRLRLYIDGVEEATVDISALGNIAINGLTHDNTYALNIGAFLTDPARFSYTFFFDGLMDEASVYRSVLTEAEVQAIYNANAAGKCS